MSPSPVCFDNRIGRSWTLAALFGMAACAGEATIQTTIVRDSAGVEIVRSLEREWTGGQGWTVASTPILDLSTTGAGEAHEFFRVADAVRLANGDIAVAMRSQIRIFSSGGEYLATVGREGEGPGEFAYLAQLDVLSPDSLVAFDYSLRRVTLVGPTRTVARVVQIDVTMHRVAMASDRLVVMTGSPAASYADAPLGQNRRLPVPVVAVSASGEATDTLAMAAGWEAYVSAGDGGYAIQKAWFGRDSHLASYGDRVILGDAIDMQYRVLRADGSVERIVRADYDLTLTPEMLAAERSAILGEDPSPRLRQLLNAMPVPGARPAYRAIEADPTGAVWLEEGLGEGVIETSRDPHSWEVFGADGRWLGQVALPGRFTVFEVGLDYVLGVHRDELDVEHVQMLSLTR